LLFALTCRVMNIALQWPQREDHMLYDFLYNADDRPLPVTEAIRRISGGFRQSIVDHIRGEAAVSSRLDQLASVNASRELLDSTNALSGQVTWVSVTDNLVDDLCFLLIPGQDVLFAYHSEAEREHARPLVTKLANLLGREVAEWHIYLTVEIPFKYLPGIANELNIKRDFFSALIWLDDDVQDVEVEVDNNCGQLGEIEEGKIIVSVSVAHEEPGRKRIDGKLRTLLPNAQFTISVLPSELPWHA
jgi:hypothetical protein